MNFKDLPKGVWVKAPDKDECGAWNIFLAVVAIKRYDDRSLGVKCELVIGDPAEDRDGYSWRGDIKARLIPSRDYSWVLHGEAVDPHGEHSNRKPPTEADLEFSRKFHEISRECDEANKREQGDGPEAVEVKDA